MGLLTSADNEKQAVIQAASWTISSSGFTIGIAAASALFQRMSLNGLKTILIGQPELFNTIRGSFDALRVLSGSPETGNYCGTFEGCERRVLYGFGRNGSCCCY